MKELQKHKKAWADFEEWWEDYVDKNDLGYPTYKDHGQGETVTIPFENLEITFEMQLGVYLKYLSDRGLLILITIHLRTDNTAWWRWSVRDDKGGALQYGDTGNQSDAYGYAIKAAFKIREDQMK